MKRVLIAMILVISATMVFADGYEPGDKASDFRLKNIDGKYVSLSDYDDAKGFIVIFTCNHCPYSKAYEQRIIELDKQFKSKGYPVIAINPNSPEAFPEDSFDKMVERAGEKNYTFPYLIDETQEVYKKFGATRTPHVFVLNKTMDGMEVSYIGAIDDNYQDASAVNTKYVSDAVNSLLAGNSPELKSTKAIGCGIK